MKLRTSIAACLVAGAVGVLSAPVSIGATLTAVTDRATWTAQVSGITTIDFDTASPLDGYAAPPANDWYMVPTYPLTILGVTFTDLTDAQQQHLYLNNYNVGNSGTVLKSEGYRLNQRNYIHIVLPAGVTAWGVDLLAGGAYATYTIKVGPDSYDVSTTGGTRSFYGFTGSTAISSIDIDYYGSNAALDNFSFGTTKTGGPTPPPAAETPEVATLLLCGTGLWAMSKVARRVVAHF